MVVLLVLFWQNPQSQLPHSTKTKEDGVCFFCITFKPRVVPLTPKPRTTTPKQHQDEGPGRQQIEKLLGNKSTGGSAVMDIIHTGQAQV